MVIAEQILKQIDEVSAEQVLETANACFDEGKMGVLVYS